MSKSHLEHHHRWIVTVGGLAVVLGIAVGGANGHIFWRNKPQFPNVENSPRWPNNNQQPQFGHGQIQPNQPPSSPKSQFDIVQGTFEQLGLDMHQWSCKHITTGREIIFALQEENADNNNSNNNNINEHQNNFPQYNPGDGYNRQPSQGQQPSPPGFGNNQQPPQGQQPPPGFGNNQQPPQGQQPPPGFGNNQQPAQNPGFVPADPSGGIPLPGLPNKSGSVLIYPTTTANPPSNTPIWDWESYATINPVSQHGTAARSASLTTPAYNGEGVLEPRIKY